MLTVVPGDMRVDLDAVKNLYAGTFITFADNETAERLAGSVQPFSFDPALELIVDSSVLQIPEIYFNAARLDRSLCLHTGEYSRIAEPRVERIAMV